MPPKLTYYRFWCSKCQEFTLHNTTDIKDCRECGTVTETYDISQIPIEKVLEQRKRYTAYQRSELKQALNYYMNPTLNIFQEMMLEDSGVYDLLSPKIIECDAGQKEIDKQQKAERDAERNRLNEERRLLLEEYKQFSKLGRNDSCACGSGLKYKKCCIIKFQNI